MAGEAVTGRYNAARHAVADEGGARRHPDSDDRSLVDRLLAGSGDEQPFDWGWGDPAAGDAVPDREPMHDIPELWDERPVRDPGDRDDPGDEHFPTPRLHGESSLDDGPADDRDRVAEDRDWSDRSRDDLGSDDWGAPAPELEDPRPGGLRPGTGFFDEPAPGEVPPEERRFDDQRFAGSGLDGDPLDALSTGRVRAEQGPFADGTPDRDTPERDPLHDGPMDGDHAAARRGPLDRERFDRSPLAPPLPDRDAFGGIGRDPEPPAALLGRDALNHDAPEGDLPAPEPGERKLVDADPRLRRWADRNRPSGPPRDGGDRPAAPAPFADEPAGDPFAADPSGPDQGGAAEGGADPFGPDRFGADLAGSDTRDRPDAAPGPAAPFGDPLAESVRTGRIEIPDVEAPRPRQEPPSEPAVPFDQGPAPEPTTVFGAVAPAGPARRGAPEEPQPPVEEYAARRRAAEQAAAAAEEAAAAAAERASAAIAAAARAAEEAEAAAETAAKAAAQANEAAEAEVRAIAESAARGEPAGRQDGRAEAPEPPTQAVPLIAPARAPGRRPPPRRPAGPPPRGARPDEPGRSGGPPPRAGHRNGPVRDSAVTGGADGEATAVLTGLDALRDPVRPRGPEAAPAEVTTVTRRRPAAEPAPPTDDVDDADDAEQGDEPEEQGLVDRLRSRPVVAAVGVGAVLVVAAIVAIFTTSEPEAAPAEAAPAALSAPVVPQPEPPAPAIDPHSKNAVAFLTALRDADIPTSSSGQAETEAAAAICTQLDQGADEAQLARSVPAVLPDVTRSQASDVVEFAQKLYC